MSKNCVTFLDFIFNTFWDGEIYSFLFEFLDSVVFRTFYVTRLPKLTSLVTSCLKFTSKHFSILLRGHITIMSPFPSGKYIHFSRVKKGYLKIFNIITKCTIWVLKDFSVAFQVQVMLSKFQIKHKLGFHRDKGWSAETYAAFNAGWSFIRENDSKAIVTMTGT